MQQLSWFAVLSVECCEYEHCRQFASHTPRNKNPGVSGPESMGVIASIRPSQSSAVEMSHEEIP
jgi:hypothetical protein